MNRYYRVGTRKLAILSLCTFGLYSLVWFFCQWVAYRDATKEDISPGWRAIFSGITSYSLFNHVRNDLVADGDTVTFSPGLFAVAYFALSAAWRLPAPWTLIGFFWFVPVLPVQAAINANARRHDPEADLNENWEWWGFLLAAFGTVLLILAAIGMLVPAEG